MGSQMQYPPVGNHQIPQWSRVGQLDKHNYPKALTKDMYNSQLHAYDINTSIDDNGAKIEDGNPAMRIQYLERTIQFLKLQHEDVLANLHAEIEQLRKQNTDLQFKLMMSQSASTQDELQDGLTSEKYQTTAHEMIQGDHSMDEYRREMKFGNKDTGVLLEQQVVELRHQVRELNNKNSYLNQMMEQMQSAELKENRKEGDVYLDLNKPSKPPSQITINLEDLDIISESPHSIVIQDRNGSAKRQPDETDFNKIVANLYKTNQKLQKELAKVKSDLRDALYSHKWTPDAYLIAKAYVNERGDSDSDTMGALPRIPTKATVRKLPELAYIRDNVSLPALKNTLGTKAADRKKRTQILQRARLERAV